MDEVIDRLRAAGCVFAEDEAALLHAHVAETGADLAALVARRCAGEPLEYVVGWAAFRGMRIAVSPGVFVPRVRTEYLAGRAIAAASAAGPLPTVLDLCCGAGAIAAAVHEALPDARLHAADIDPAAVACARDNLGAAGEVYTGDLFDSLPGTLRAGVDVLVANVPYVPTDAIALMPPEAREHERRIALDGGPAGLDTARRVFAGAPVWLAPRGTVLIELGGAQARELAPDVAALGYAVRVVADDDSGQTVLSAVLERS